MQHRLCILGGGPRGTYVLLHMLAAWQKQPVPGRLHIDIVEPVEFGAGVVYCTTQPDFLRLNTIASQVTAYPDDTVTSPLQGPRGPTLYEWYRTPHNGLAADAYPSRRDTGRYLAAVFDKVLGMAPPGVTIDCHRTWAIDMQNMPADQWEIPLANGEALRCNAAVLTIGCAGSARTDTALLAQELKVPLECAGEQLVARAYPIERAVGRIKPGQTVGVLGLGLTALDVIRACTVGRGGKFQRERNRLRYIPCGDEPQIVAWSRTGLPLMGRGMNQKPIDHKVAARHLTEDAIDTLRRERQRACGTPKLDFARDLLPLLVREIADAFHGARATRRARAHPAGEPGPGSRNGHGQKFRWRRLVSPLTDQVLRSADGFRSFFLDYVRRDVEEALRGNVLSPVKSACDVIRDLRDKLRYAVEFGGLTPDSQWLFDTDFTALHNRLAVGPPVEAAEELLALVEAGIVDPFCGPAPHLCWDPCRGRLTVRPSAFDGPSRELSVLVNARLSRTDVTTSSSPFVRNLLAAGHIVPYVNRLNDTAYRPGGIAVTDAYRVVDRHGHPHASFFAIGAITEGCTWYSQVLARPYVNSRSMRDAASVAQSLCDYFAVRAVSRAEPACATSPNDNGNWQAPEAIPETAEAALVLTAARSCVP
jgi:uncharacterized NAD(P)/FAD-binding protein YdhS